jgi:hypothetical protein
MLRNRVLLTQVREEKVKIHTERKICVVCKGDALGFMYTCMCNTIYCENCARALINLENACWVCNRPIDPEKPVKSYEKKEEERTTEKVAQKEKMEKK